MLFSSAGLGLVLGGNTVSAAEISGGRVVKSAQFPLPGADALKNPDVLGRELARLLKTNGFTAKVAAIGVPARWVMTREKKLPPAAPDALAAMLRLQIERDFALDPSALVTDFITGTAGADGQPVLALAMLRDRLDQISKLCVAAGLKLKTIAPVGLAVHAALIAQGSSGDYLYCGAQGFELCAPSAENSGIPQIKHVAAAVTPMLAPEILRAMAGTGARATKDGLTLINDTPLSEADLASLSQELGMPLRPVPAGLMAEVNGAVSIAKLLSSKSPLTADFLHSRLEVKPPPRIKPAMKYGIAAAVLLCAGAGWFYYDLTKEAEQIAELHKQRNDLLDGADTAREFIGRVSAVRNWNTRRSDSLECLRAMTLCFPEDGRAWASNISLKDDRRGLLTAKAIDQKSATEVLDRLQGSGFLSDVKLLFMRGSGLAARSTEQTFTVSFVYNGTEKPPLPELPPEAFEDMEDY